jgi:MHS family shikimate/dehydroshikimate transporter-like MFS transporter
MATHSAQQQRTMRRVAIGSFVGSLLEWYDFFLFGTASAVVFGPLFFPSDNPMAGTIAAFATFGIGFVMRPLGGIIFGHLGDKFGRKSSLIATLIIMGVGTAVIGFLPTYAQIGMAAPILLVICRLLQGLGIGGEYAGAALMTYEHAPEKRKGFWGSLPQAASPAGILLATAVFAIVSSFGTDFLMSWGWRIPFMLSIGLLFVGLFIRLAVSESPEFLRAAKEREQSDAAPKIPLIEVFRRHPKNLALAFGARIADAVSSNVINAFGIYYVSTHVGLSSQVGLYGMLIASGISLVAIPLYGALSDRIGRKKVYITGAVLGVVLAFPLFILFSTGQVWAAMLAFSLGYILVPTMMFSVQSVFFAELFGTDVRYTGVSLAYQLSSIVGGYVPTAATALLLVAGGEPWLVAGGLAVACLISAVCVFFAKDVANSRRRDDAVDQPVAGGLPREGAAAV